MIVGSQEYNNLLSYIKDYNYPTIAPLNPTSVVMDIDLNSRVVETPEYLSVEDEHLAETVYFRVDRFFEHQDLANTIGIIEYVNAKGDGYIYPIPYYDIITEKENNKIIIPWCIDGFATMYAGIVNFQIRFYEIDENKQIVYNLKTLPASSKIAKGLDFTTIENNPDYQRLLSIADQLIYEVNDLKRERDLYWIVLD
jgi:hypothetical protein